MNLGNFCQNSFKIIYNSFNISVYKHIGVKIDRVFDPENILNNILILNYLKFVYNLH